MKVSRTWLQKYFDTELPSAEKLADALTFHAFEIEEIEGDMLDVKVLPDRACYALSHRGIAKELSAILGLPMKEDPLRAPLPSWSTTSTLSIEADKDYVLRHTGAIMRGVKVGPSPAWLTEALESVGQRSINNIVDASNYVMLNIGQPTHAFDAGKITWDGDTLRIKIRRAENGEKVTILSGEEYTLKDSMFVFSDALGGGPLDLAGLKGGKDSGVSDTTTDLFISAGNYDGTLIRRMAQSLHLYTDASARFQNRPSPELTAYGMRDLLALIQEVAGGTVEGVLDVYPSAPEKVTLSVNPAFINGKLGASFTPAEMEKVFTDLDLAYEKKGDEYEITPPFERCDVRIPEDLVEEVGRILGYDRVPATPLPDEGEGNTDVYRGIERIKDVLRERGFTELSTPSFAVTGDIGLSNPLQEDKPYLRATITENMRDALTRAAAMAPRVLGPVKEVMLYEVGNVFTKNAELRVLTLGYRPLVGKGDSTLTDAVNALAELGVKTLSVNPDVVECDLTNLDLAALGKDYGLTRITVGAFEPFSVYPFALRDVAVWTPDGTDEATVADIIRTAAGELLVRLDLVDRFAKDGRTSYAFRLVLEASDRTLTDTELADVMGKVAAALSATSGFEVR